MKKGFVILTEKELENICGEFFDKGYYANLYRTETTDNSVEIFSNCKDEILKKVIERSKQKEYLEAKKIVEKYEKQLNIPNVSAVRYNSGFDWRVGTYFISNTFEVVQYKACGNGQHALVGKGNNYEEALKILKDRNKDGKFIEKREVDGVVYFHYTP